MLKGIANSTVIILLIIIAAYSVLCFTTRQYFRLTADSMLYFSIAEKYAAGDFQGAVNGYWGPLLAWLLIPFLYFGTSDIFAIECLNLIFGILTIIGIWVLSFRFEISGTIRNLILISSIPIVFMFSLVQPMDFLLVCILVFYLGIIFKSDYPESISSGISSGMLGSLAYFTKAYAFPFFIVHFFIMNVFHYSKNISGETRNKVIKNAITGFLFFFLISGVWIATISNKYGHITFSTMRDTNFNAPGPEDMKGGLEFGVPVFYKGFFEPPNETAFVIWEDPSYLRGNPWSPWQSFAHFKHFIRLTLKNIAEGLAIFESFSTLSVAIITAYILLLVARPGSELLPGGGLLYPLVTLVLFSGGFVLFHFEARYVWLANVLLLLMGGHVLSVLVRTDFFEPDVRKVILIAFFVVSFIFVPARFILQTGKNSIDKDMHELSIDLKKYDIKGNFASNRESGGHEAWHKTFRLAYWLDGRYYGQRGENTTDEELKRELKEYDIDYYFLWGEENCNPQFLSQYSDVMKGEITGLKIYSLKEKKEQPRL